MSALIASIPHLTISLNEFSQKRTCGFSCRYCIGNLLKILAKEQKGNLDRYRDFDPHFQLKDWGPEFPAILRMAKKQGIELVKICSHTREPLEFGPLRELINQIRIGGLEVSIKTNGLYFAQKNLDKDSIYEIACSMHVIGDDPHGIHEHITGVKQGPKLHDILIKADELRVKRFLVSIVITRDHTVPILKNSLLQLKQYIEDLGLGSKMEYEVIFRCVSLPSEARNVPGYQSQFKKLNEDVQSYFQIRQAFVSVSDVVIDDIVERIHVKIPINVPFNIVFLGAQDDKKLVEKGKSSCTLCYEATPASPFMSPKPGVIPVDEVVNYLTRSREESKRIFWQQYDSIFPNDRA